MTFTEAHDGARLWYSIEQGPSALPPLVLVQGRALDHHAWDSVRGDFGDRTLVLMDHRGTGESSSEFTPDWSTRDFARDVIAVLDAAGIDRAHFYGHSMGGRIIQWIGADFADRALSVVAGAVSVGDESGPPRPSSGATALAAGDPKTLTALFYPDEWIAAHPQQASELRFSPQSPEAMRVHGEASDRRDGPRPSDISVPTLVLFGTADELVDPRNAEVFRQQVPNVRVEQFAGARHAYWAGRPEVHEIVNEFLTSHDPD